MATSVLLGSADSGLSFSLGGAGSGAVLHSNGPGPQGPASWNRSVDRALDEAAASGTLNLSGRKLKEFPRSSANHDLTDTTRADLSRNRLSDLPLEVCMFVSLESLNLYQNCLRSLPEGLINLQSLTYLNLSRNQLSVLPPVVCGLPLKVLIACNNKLVCLPEEVGQLRHLTELDVSCNEIQMLPPQVGHLENLRDLNIRRNHLLHLPPELAELPLVRVDFSCNKVTSIPVCFRRLSQLQSIILDNNPLQSPPAQICIKGKVHIFKYLNLEASKSSSELPEYERRPLTLSSCGDDLYPGRPYGALDSGFNSVDSGDKRWLGNEVSDESSDLRDQRIRAAADINGTHGEGEQMDFMDGCAAAHEEEERKTRSDSLSSQFMAYIEKRIIRESSPVKTCLSNCVSRTEERRHNRSVVDGVTSHPQRGLEKMRKEAQLAALRYDEERHRNHLLQRDSKHKPVQSNTKCSPDTEEEDRSVPSSTVGGTSCRTPSVRPESFLYRMGQKEERSRGDPQSQEGGAPSTPLIGQEAELVDQLRKNIEARLKVSLPSDLGSALTDGVVLCHLANHVRPRSVPSIHVPSPAVPKLTMAKCRRNVENFLEACRRLGVPQTELCLPLHVLEERGLPQVAATVSALLSLAPPRCSVATATAPGTSVTI
ncbi:leucine-rich repeat and calponin homology domain-containing protein 3 isoform X2 [Gouania willdenowi]|uniref:leucine-rich repeat and calponin homology domain-containing protein 3 isoform X2 n=1 Tax=Gouania willdenowi TaxID=441366 RepID=UPI0010560D6E|nr:leucine-rich repeat and calponin homology domain-containing protein 3 isoform X2 [Gouania willdenowi]